MIKLALGVVVVISVFECVWGQESEAQIEERLVSYQRCRVDSDCRENSFCYDNDNDRVGLCKCQAGFELLFRNRTYYTCLKLALWGEECQIDTQCVDNLGSLAKCDGICGCSNGTHRYPSDGRCYQSVLLDDFCRTDANCILEDGSYAFCADGQCECNLGLRPSPDKKLCVLARNLGQNCTEDSQCSFIGNSICREVCRCSVGYVVSRNGTTCLRAATYFSDPCDENDQCSEFLRDSLCKNGNCTCQDGYHGYKASCVRTAKIGQACTATEQCIPSPRFQSAADCIEGVCQCLPGVTDPDGKLGCNRGTISTRFSLNIFLPSLFIIIYSLFCL